MSQLNYITNHGTYITISFNCLVLTPLTFGLQMLKQVPGWVEDLAKTPVLISRILAIN